MIVVRRLGVRRRFIPAPRDSGPTLRGFAGLSGMDLRGLGRIVWNPNVVEAPLGMWVDVNAADSTLIHSLAEIHGRTAILRITGGWTTGVSSDGYLSNLELFRKGTWQVLTSEGEVLDDGSFDSYTTPGDFFSVPPGSDMGVKTWGVIVGAASTVSMAASAYHGYKRTGSIGWAIGWGLLGALFPVVTPAVALAQGFGKRKGR